MLRYLTILFALFIYLPSTVLAQDCPAACKQDDFPAFLEWYSNLSAQEQYNRRMGRDDPQNLTKCGREPRPDNPVKGKAFTGPKSLINPKEREEMAKARHHTKEYEDNNYTWDLVDVSPTEKHVFDKYLGTPIYKAEFIWDGRCWWMSTTAIIMAE